jgi:hypothetical protein
MRRWVTAANRESETERARLALATELAREIMADPDSIEKERQDARSFLARQDRRQRYVN